MLTPTQDIYTLVAMRVSFHLKYLANHLLKDPDKEHYPYQVHKETDIHPSVAARIFQNLELKGWVQARLETPEPLDRPRRRYYTLTEIGYQELKKITEKTAPKIK